MEHHLNVRTDALPVKQKHRYFSHEKDKTIRNEMQKLVKAKQIWEV